MCLIVLAYQAHADFPLLVAANRDEFYARPTRNSAFWEEYPTLLAGKDLEAGGTWMGVTRGGRFAAITNYRDPDATLPAPRSRGELTLDFLLGNSSPMSFLADLESRAHEYAGYNLLLGDGDTLAYGSNSAVAEHGGTALLLEPGIYGLSNARLDTPWPKLILAREGMANLLDTRPDHPQLARLVSDRQLAQSDELSAVGLEGEMAQALSAQFIQAGPYGTRATTTLISDHTGQTSWNERVFDDTGEQVSEQTFKLP